MRSAAVRVRNAIRRMHCCVAVAVELKEKLPRRKMSARYPLRGLGAARNG
ncbi:MAG: hypothetical protein NVSMB58_27720 [Terriglobales bacterium]